MKVDGHVQHDLYKIISRFNYDCDTFYITCWHFSFIEFHDQADAIVKNGKWHW